MVCSGSDDHTVRLWDIVTGAFQQFDMTAAVSTMDVQATENVVGVGDSNGNLLMINALTRSRHVEIPNAHTGSTSLSWLSVCIHLKRGESCRHLVVAHCRRQHAGHGRRG